MFSSKNNLTLFYYYKCYFFVRKNYNLIFRIVGLGCGGICVVVFPHAWDNFCVGSLCFVFSYFIFILMSLVTFVAVISNFQMNKHAFHFKKIKNQRKTLD